MYEFIIKCELKINEEGLFVNFKMVFESLSMMFGFFLVLFVKINMFILFVRNCFIVK